MKRIPILFVAALFFAASASAQQTGSTYGDRFVFTGTRCTQRSGTGSPEGAVLGSVCDTYTRKDASGVNPALYAKLTGTATNTGWVAVGASYPGAGVAVSTGTAWGSSLAVGTGPNDLVQLNGSSQLPAVSAALLTNFPTLNQNTSGTAGGLAFGSDARGDLPVRGASVYGRLAKGSAGAVLTGDGTDTAWSAYTVAVPGASGAVLYSDGTNWTRQTAPTVSAANMTSFPTLNQSTSGTAAGFTGNLTGDVTSTAMATTVVKLNGTSLAGLATGLLKNTTGTGVPTIGIAGTDYLAPTLDAILNTGFDFKIAMATPTAPTITQNSSGTLANGTYKLTLTAIDAGGGQTMYPATGDCVVTTTSNDACIGTWTAVPGAVTYRIWISDAGGATPNKYWPVASPTLTKTITSLAMAGVVADTLPVGSTAYVVNLDASGPSWIRAGTGGFYFDLTGGLQISGGLTALGKSQISAMLKLVGPLNMGANENTSAINLTRGGTVTGSSITNTLEFLSGVDSSTFNDNSSAASSTKAVRTILGIPAPTLTATNAVTYTDATTWYIGGAPTASTNVTITNVPTALWSVGPIRADGGFMVGNTGVGISKTCTSAPTAQTVTLGVITAMTCT